MFRISVMRERGAAGIEGGEKNIFCP